MARSIAVPVEKREQQVVLQTLVHALAVHDEEVVHRVSVTHRDSRLALCLLTDGSVVVAITRFGAVGRSGETLPWGPTVPEMTAFMRTLGCRRAMLLDGGLSSQLAVRRLNGTVSRWSNWRRVPLGLVVSARAGAIDGHRTPARRTVEPRTR